MTAELLMNAIGDISDRYISEFSSVKPKKQIALWIKLSSLAACLALTMTIGFFAVMSLGNIETSPNYNPQIRLNNAVYVYTSTAHELPEGWELISEVKKFTQYVTENGDSNCCKQGEKIYQHPDKKHEIYVYTKLFSGSDKYWYVKFKSKKIEMMESTIS